MPTPSDSTNPSEPFGLVRKIAIWAFLAIFWALFLYFIAYIIGWVPHETHVTKYNQQTGQEQPEVYETTSYLIWQTFKGLNYISPTVAALATVGVVFFTATLYELRQVVPGQPASRGGAPLEIAIGADIPKASVAVYRTELPVVID